MGGLTPTFWDETTLEPGEWITWQEQWYPVGDIGGFRFANNEVALNLTMTSVSVQVAAASTHPLKGNLILWENGQEVNRWPVTLAPEEPFRGSFSPGKVILSNRWGVSLVDENGRELATMK